MAEATQNQLQVRLVTPDRILVDTVADAVELPSRSGYIEVLYGHAPLLAELGAGEVILHGGSDSEQKYFVAWGFVEVLGDRVTILAESAQKPADIDTGAADAQLKHGQEMWDQAGDSEQRYDAANAEIRAAEAKLESASGK